MSREPEGQTFATIDTVVNDTRFVPPQALGEGLARVKLSVTSQCPGEAVLTPGHEHRFLIDARPACAVRSLTIDDASERLVRWAPTAGAEGYEVFGYDPTEGRLLFKLETRVPAAMMPAASAVPVVVAVRARCGEVFGQLGYIVY